MESSTSLWRLAAWDTRPSCGRSSCRSRVKVIGNWRLEVSGFLNLELQKSPVSNFQSLRALPPEFVNLIVPSVQIDLSGFLRATTLRECRATADERSTRQCHRSEIPAVSQRPQTHGEDRAERKRLNGDPLTGELLCGAGLDAPDD